MTRLYQHAVPGAAKHRVRMLARFSSGGSGDDGAKKWTAWSDWRRWAGERGVDHAVPGFETVQEGVVPDWHLGPGIVLRSDCC